MKAHIRVEFAALRGAAWQCTVTPELILVRLDRELFGQFADSPTMTQPIAALIIAHAIAGECLEWLFAPEIITRLGEHPEPATLARILLRSMATKEGPVMRPKLQLVQ